MRDIRRVPGMLLTVTLALASAAKAQTKPDLRSLAIPFVENRGQQDPRVAFYASTFSGSVYVTRDGRIVHALPSWTLVESAVSGHARPASGRRAVTTVNSYLGNDPRRWRTGLGTYESVSLGEVWPGVLLSLRAHGHEVEKIFTVLPGGDPSRIRMRVSGARSLRVDASGALVASSRSGEAKLTAPIAWQERGGERHSVAVAYEVRGNRYGFRLGAYDRSLPLVIDPILQSTYLGGGLDDYAIAVGINPVSPYDVYVAGHTASQTFPGAGGSPVVNRDDAFVARLSGDLTTLISATYLGGTGKDSISRLVINPSSPYDLYVAGFTSSTDFPTTAGAAQTTFGGGSSANGGPWDGFVAVLNSSLGLTAATYLGGSGNDQALGLAIHPVSGDVYVTGQTDSPFPHTFGGLQASPADGFVAQLSSDLATWRQSTYVGGNGADKMLALAIHPSTGNVYVAGQTASTSLPFVTGKAQTSLHGPTDAFVACVAATLKTTCGSTYLGGSLGESAGALAIGPAAPYDVYVGGWTSSSNFPVTPGAPVTTFGGFQDGFVARLTSDLVTLGTATYLGAGDVRSIAISGLAPFDVYAGGSAGATLPGANGGAQGAYGGNGDGYVSRFTSSLGTLTQSTYLGGAGTDTTYALAVHPLFGVVYASGVTGSADFPATAFGAQPALAGGLDSFVAYLSADLTGCTSPPSAAISAPPDVCPGKAGYSASVPDAGPGARYAWTITNGTITAGAGTRTITFTAGTPPGSVGLAATVLDGSGCRDAKTISVPFALCVPPPHFTSASQTTFVVGTFKNFSVTAASADGSPLTITTSSPLPAGLTFVDLGGGGGGMLAGAPGPNASGTYPVTFTATDVHGSTDQSFVLEVDVPAFPFFEDLGSLPDGGSASVSLTGGGLGCVFKKAAFIPVSGDPRSPQAAPPSFVALPKGLFGFVLTGCDAGSRVTVQIEYLGGSVDLTPTTVYWKYGPRPGPLAPAWYLFASTTTVIAPGDSVVSFDVTDGGLGDDDLAANGTIVDAGGPAAAPAAGALFYPVPPCRVLDTRGAAAPALAANAARTFAVTGACQIPSTAKALAVNVTVLPAATGFLTVYPGDAARPPTINSGFVAGKTRATNTLALLASDGSGTLAVYNESPGAVGLVLDVAGYFQ